MLACPKPNCVAATGRPDFNELVFESCCFFSEPDSFLNGSGQVVVLKGAAAVAPEGCVLNAIAATGLKPSGLGLIEHYEKGIFRRLIEAEVVPTPI